MATASQQQITAITTNLSLAAISAANPSLRLTAHQLSQIGTGHLVLVPPPSSLTPIPKGCITQLYYADNDRDLEWLQVDGTWYRAENLKDFKETFERAACCHFCINFCITLVEPGNFSHPENHLSMVNLYPCSECRPSASCGCGEN